MRQVDDYFVQGSCEHGGELADMSLPVDHFPTVGHTGL